MKIKLLSEKDFDKFYKVVKDYTKEDVNYSKLKRIYGKHPSLFIACYDKSELIGEAFGFIKKEDVVLESIAVIAPYWRKGLGSRIIKFFEKQAKNAGKRKIKVGSGPDTKTEDFYVKNGYKPVYLSIRVHEKKLQKTLERKYEAVRGESKGEILELLIKTSEYNPKIREELKKEFKAKEVIYLFEKSL
jgi:GNAT superfamily N-acetyltransferase